MRSRYLPHFPLGLEPVCDRVSGGSVTFQVDVVRPLANLLLRRCGRGSCRGPAARSRSRARPGGRRSPARRCRLPSRSCRLRSGFLFSCHHQVLPFVDDRLYAVRVGKFRFSSPPRTSRPAAGSGAAPGGTPARRPACGDIHKRGGAEPAALLETGKTAPRCSNGRRRVDSRASGVTETAILSSGRLCAQLSSERLRRRFFRERSGKPGAGYQLLPARSGLSNTISIVRALNRAWTRTHAGSDRYRIRTYPRISPIVVSGITA